MSDNDLFARMLMGEAQADPKKREFSLNATENERADLFIAEHTANHGVKGLSFAFMFLPTGIGDGVRIGCNKCSQMREITDTSDW